MSKLSFEEMRYCFAYGWFLATIMLGLSWHKCCYVPALGRGR